MDLFFRQLNPGYFSNMYFYTSLGFSNRDRCCCCRAATWASHLFLVSFTRRRSYQGFRRVHGASSSFARLEFQKKSGIFFFFFFSEMRFCVHRILFILLAHVSPDLHSFHFEQPPSILLRLTASNECPIFKSWLMEWRKEEQRSLSMKFRVLMCQPSAFATIKICVMGNRCTN